MENLVARYIYQGDAGLPLLHGEYDPWLVLLSCAVAIASATLALQLVRLSAGQGRNPLGRRISLLASSLSLGVGIWSMHFIGMLAHTLHTRITYDPLITTLSMLPGVLASFLALNLLFSGKTTLPRLLVSGTAVGAGIGIMHYTGMLAMKMTPVLQFDLGLVGLSVVVAVVMATFALWVGIYLSTRGTLPPSMGVPLGGFFLGGAISAMHYTGMASARFIGTHDPAFKLLNDHSMSMALSVTLVTVLIGFLALSINALSRYRQMLSTLQASETRLSTILATTVDGIITLNTRGIVLSFNKAAEVLFGWRADEVIGKHVVLLIPEFQGESLLQQIDTDRDLIGVHKAGHHFPIRLAVGQASLPEEKLLVGFVSDLSQRHAMEAAVREKDTQLRTMMSTMPGVVFRCLYDTNWSMLLINDAVYNLTGWSAEDFLQGRQNFLAITHPEDSARILAEVEAAVGSRSNYSVEYRIFNRKGEERWVSEYGAAQYDELGKPIMLDGVMIDITERKHTNADYEGIVNAINLSTSVAEFSIDGFILDANSNFLKLLDYTLEQIRGHHHSIFCSAADASSERYKEKWRALRQGKFVQGEFLRLGNAGRQVWIHAAYSPVLDVDGKVAKVIMFMIDINERKLMEQDLRIAKERAEQAASVKSTFLANMSHEIRTPMNAVIGFSELMMDTPMEETQRSYMSTISNSAKSLLHLLNDILDSAKLEKGMLELEMINFSMTALLDSIVSTLWLQARGKGLQLKLDLAPEAAGYYVGAANRIQQVLTNLLGNALKFTDKGFVQLRVRPMHPDLIRFDVTDTGIGIAADRLEQIFEPFTQADATMSRRFGGTGLGTTISKQLAELMGGQLTATSAEGEGSCFTLIIPLKPGEAHPLAVISSQHTLRPLRILVADDVKQNRDLLRIMLDRHHHAVTLVNNGAEAVMQFRKQDFDIILMDVQMPVVDGLSATRQIREIEHAEQRSRTPIIALTASVLEEDRIAAREAGMEGFASKPVDIEHLTLEMLRLIGSPGHPAPAILAQVPLPSADFSLQRGVALWGDESVYYHELQQFVQQHLRHIDSIAMAARNGESLALRELTHAGKGVAANLALTRLCQIYGEFEHAAMAEDVDAYPVLLGVLQESWHALNEAVAKLHIDDDVAEHSGEPESIDQHALALQSLQALRAATAEATLDDALLNTLLKQAPLSWQAELRVIVGILNDFEFEEALIKIDQLLSQQA